MIWSATVSSIMQSLTGTIRCEADWYTPEMICPCRLTPKSGLHLVAVVVGIFHADDLLHVAEAAEQADGRRLFEMQLLVI